MGESTLTDRIKRILKCAREREERTIMLDTSDVERLVSMAATSLIQERNTSKTLQLGHVQERNYVMRLIRDYKTSLNERIRNAARRGPVVQSEMPFEFHARTAVDEISRKIKDAPPQGA